MKAERNAEGVVDPRDVGKAAIVVDGIGGDTAAHTTTTSTQSAPASVTTHASNSGDGSDKGGATAPDGSQPNNGDAGAGTGTGANHATPIFVSFNQSNFEDSGEKRGFVVNPTVAHEYKTIMWKFQDGVQTSDINMFLANTDGTANYGERITDWPSIEEGHPDIKTGDTGMMADIYETSSSLY